jgi:hypothetical protein
MTRKKMTSVARRVDGHDKWAFDQSPDQWGEKLERFFEDNDVGMDGVIHWRDVGAEDIDLYNLTGWFDMDSFRLSIWSTFEESKRIETFSYGRFDPLQYFLNPVYQGRGTFRYEEPGENSPVDTEMKFIFNNLTNLGVRDRPQL